MKLKTIDEQLSVGPQITPDEVSHLAQRGFRSIICNRPDDEDPGQPAFAEIAAAAAENGMEARHIPVSGQPAFAEIAVAAAENGMEARHIPVSGQPDAAQAAAFAEAMEAMPNPVYAYCRSGGRSGALAAMSRR